MSNIIVVCGIIEYQSKILIGKKIKKNHIADLGGKWHLPGGKVKENESLKTALKREIKEETNLNVEIKEQLGNNILNFNNIIVKIFYFKCIPKTHDLVAADDLQHLKWVKKENLLKKLDKKFIKLLPQKMMTYFENH